MLSDSTLEVLGQLVLLIGIVAVICLIGCFAALVMSLFGG